MRAEVPSYSLPRWRWTRWLTDAGPDVPAEIRVALIGSLYGTLPIFAGGVINTIAVSLLIALRIPTLPFISTSCSGSAGPVASATAPLSA